MGKPVKPRPRVTVWDVAEAILGNRAQLGRLIRECGDAAIIRAVHASLDNTAENQAEYFVAVARGHEQPPQEVMQARAKELRNLAANCNRKDPVAALELYEMARMHKVSTSGRDAFAVADAILAKFREAV